MNIQPSFSFLFLGILLHVNVNFHVNVNTSDHKKTKLCIKSIRYDWLNCEENWLGWKSKAKVHAIKRESFFRNTMFKIDFRARSISSKSQSIREHPFNTSANFHDFLPQPPYCRQFFYYYSRLRKKCRGYAY